MLYLVIAKDGTDDGAAARRQRVRQQHLEAARPAAEDGTLQVGGALLDDDGTMIGSALVVEAESEAELRRWLDADIYSREGVWQSFEIYPFKRSI